MTNQYRRGCSTMIRPPRQRYLRCLTVDEESDLPRAPHSFEVARVWSISQAAHGTHIWTGSFWSPWQFYDFERDDHDLYLTEEPLLWPWT